MHINTVVQAYYETPGIAEAYARRTTLLPPEEAILARLDADLRGARLLDIGVGAGRTTPWLRAIAGSYVGIDYSERMLDLCRANHPEAELLHCDARHMPFGDESFDAVFIPFNALDDVDHADRMMILREASRVLRAGGPLVFSSHNPRCPRKSAYRPPRIVWAGGLAPSIRHNRAALAKYARGIANHRRAIRHERREAEYSLLNDQSYTYGLLAYYITPENQRAQLARAGFTLDMMFGADGRPVTESEMPRDPWVYYVGRSLKCKV
jgi:ubiquinone/menaquinone biosynthesis C-methylase UbiE